MRKLIEIITLFGENKRREVYAELPAFTIKVVPAQGIMTMFCQVFEFPISRFVSATK